MLDTADALVAELLIRAVGARATASELMRDAFRKRGLKSRQQKRVKEIFYSAIANERMIDRAIEVGTPSGGVAPQFLAPLRVLVTRVLSGDLSPKAAAAMINWVDWERIAGLPEEVRTIEDPVERLEIRGSLPHWLAERLVSQHRDTADELVEALCGRPPVVIRANTLRGTREELAARLAEDGIETRAVDFAAHGLEVVSSAQLFRTSAYREGWFEMQDQASQLVAELVAPPPRSLVVDACAGAGGKALALAAALGNKGTVACLDVDLKRLNDLRTRARRAGAQNVRVMRTPPDAWSGEAREQLAAAERILIDAPCSGIGSLRRNPEMRWRLDRAELRRLRDIQLELLARTVPLLRPRARIVYATCTVLAQENESVINATLERFPTLELVSIVEILGGERGRAITDESGNYLKMYPHVHGTDGFFAAVLRHRRDA